MDGKINRQILLAKRPMGGMPDETNFKIVETPLTPLKNGEVLIETQYLSVDPYIRGRMDEGKSYIPSFQLDHVIKGRAIGKVIDSKSPTFKTGELVSGIMGWEDFHLANEKEVFGIIPETDPVTIALGLLGMTGLTAYIGMIDICNPIKGETVVVSGAAGAVGNVVGQIAKIKDCRAVGIAGSDEKVRYLIEDLNFDAAINYKTTKDLNAALSETCPSGVDIYFDNVGGEISDAVLSKINDNARIAVCGQIAFYNVPDAPLGPRIQRLLLNHTAMMKGFLVSRHENRFNEGLSQLKEWYKSGKLKNVETIIEGFENTPKAFLGLFKGENLGKQIVKVR
jgi:NADPH-dependent curcumin reductase CurA